MSNPENPQNSRRAMLQKTILTSTALTLGLLGISERSGAAKKTSSSVKKRKNDISAANPPKWADIRQKYFGSTDKPYAKPSLSSVSTQDYSGDLSGLKTKLVGHLQKSLQVDTAGNAMDDNPLLQRIDQYLHNLKVSDVDDLKTTFLATQAEMLLDQAASLLDRAAKDRAQWDELAIKNFIQTIDFNQFIDLDNLHKEETDHMYAGVNNGFYQQQVNNIQRLLDTELMTQSVLTVASQFYTDFFTQKWGPGIIDDVVAHYSEAVQKENQKLNGDAAIIAADLTMVFQHSMANQYSSNYLENNSYQKLLDISTRKVQALQAALDWEIANRDFQFRRTNISRTYQYKKIASSNDSNGILNYNKRLGPLGDRFKQDFLNALARLQVCSLGLDKIYGYSAQLPNITKQDGLFDDCITWARNAINYYNRFLKLDQTYVLPISLKNLLIKSNQPFNPEKQSEIDTSGIDSSSVYGQMLARGVFQFNIDEHMFPNQKHVRIRGINMFVSLTPYKKLQANIDLVNGCIMAEVIPPPTSFYRLINGTPQGITKPLDYKKPYFAIPSLKVGRIGTRDFIRTPETAGTSTFYNLSPYGAWTINLPQIISGNLTKLVYIDDIYFDLIVTVRTDTTVQ